MSMIGNYRRLSTDQLQSLRATPEVISDFLYDESRPASDHLDVDKTWHAIHYLLFGDTWDGSGPLYDAVLGGEVLGDQDVGQGPARFLTATEVKLTAEALSEVSATDLLEKFDAEQMNANDIYPRWNDNKIDREYIAGNFLRLVEFFRRAADGGQAMLLYIN